MRFKKFSIIISLALVVVCLCSFVAPSASASFLPGSGGFFPGSGGLGGLLPYISADLADWIIDNGFDISNYIKSLFDDDVCELSGNGRHDFVQRNLTGSDSGMYYVCQYCGELGSEVFNEAYGTPTTGDTEGTGFLKQVEDELGTTSVGKGGYLVWVPDWKPVNFLLVRGGNRISSSTFPVNGSAAYDTSYSFSSDAILIVPKSGSLEVDAPLMSFSLSYSFSVPVDGLYELDPYKGFVGYYDTTDFSFDWSDSPHTYLKSNGLYTVTFSFNFADKFKFKKFYAVIYPPHYKVTPLSGLLDLNNSPTYNINTRATSFTGDLGILGDNGQLTKVEGDQIFNETTNNYYNPSTGTTSTVTDWTYDYSDRSYHLTLESGDTVTVTYGDENITIQEGDITYNVYYIIEGSASSDPCPEGGAHDWQAGETVDATCTVAGFKTETCSKCGEERTTELPALGHKWKVKQSVQTKYDDTGQLVQEGYTIYECERCGEQYKSTDSSGPPGGMTPGSGSGTGSGSGSGTGSSEDDESIWSKLGKFLGTLGDGLIDFVLALIGKVLDWLISLAEFIGDKLVAVAKVILDIFDFLPGLFTGFLTFLESAFGFLPTEIVMILTFGIAAIVFIGIIKAIRR